MGAKGSVPGDKPGEADQAESGAEAYPVPVSWTWSHSFTVIPVAIYAALDLCRIFRMAHEYE